jgi:hypothetical protein
MKNGQKWPIVEKKTLFETKIYLQLRFDIQKFPDYHKNDAYATRHHIETFLQD